MKEEQIKTVNTSSTNEELPSLLNSESRSLSTIALNFKKSLFYKKADNFELVDSDISFKNLPLIKRYISGNNIVHSNKYSNTSRKQHRKIALQIKNARILALLPFVQNDASSYENYSS